MAGERVTEHPYAVHVRAAAAAALNPHDPALYDTHTRWGKLV